MHGGICYGIVSIHGQAMLALDVQSRRCLLALHFIMVMHDGACKVSSGGRSHAAVLMGTARRMMGTDRQHTKASVCLVVSARCRVTGLPLPQAPPAAPRALPAAPGLSRRQVRDLWARAPWDRCTAGEAPVWDVSGGDQVPCPYGPCPHTGCCQRVCVSPHALGCCACVAGALRRG